MKTLKMVSSIILFATLVNTDRAYGVMVSTLNITADIVNACAVTINKDANIPKIVTENTNHLAQHLFAIKCSSYIPTTVTQISNDAINLRLEY